MFIARRLSTCRQSLLLYCIRVKWSIIMTFFHNLLSSLLKLPCVSGIWTSLTWFDGLVSGSIQFSLLPQLPKMIQLTLKVVKSDPKIIILLLLPRLSLNAPYTHCRNVLEPGHRILIACLKVKQNYFLAEPFNCSRDTKKNTFRISSENHFVWHLHY